MTLYLKVEVGMCMNRTLQIFLRNLIMKEAKTFQASTDIQNSKKIWNVLYRFSLRDKIDIVIINRSKTQGKKKIGNH